MTAENAGAELAPLSIYIVAEPRYRYVVLARSAEDAADTIGRMTGADAAQRAAFDVGRIGRYDPGIAGDRLALASWPILVREIVR